MDEPDVAIRSRQTLTEALLQRGMLSPKKGLELTLSLAQQVHAMHQRGLTHRAVCADEVLVDGRLQPQLSPPQAVRHLEADRPDACPPEFAASDDPGAWAGCAWKVPERIDAAAAALREAGWEVDPRRIDVYQLGGLLCRVLTGESVLGYMYDPRVKARLPRAVRKIVQQALGFDAAHRYADCGALVRALGEALAATGSGENPTLPFETPRGGHSRVVAGDTPKDGGPAPATPGPRQAPEDRPPFARLGPYRIEARIGSGGMGDVYRAYDESLRRSVAVKVLPPLLAEDEDFVRRFRAEATAAARIDHPNVVPIHFIGEDSGHHYFVMQYVEGESLAALLGRRHRLPLGEALQIVQQCLAGLGTAHGLGLIHRDVKPGNILIDGRTGNAVLVDFGLGRRLDKSVRMTATGAVLGTVDYIAPEQARGLPVDGRADIYALGVLLYQLLSGRLDPARKAAPPAPTRRAVRPTRPQSSRRQRPPPRRRPFARPRRRRGRPGVILGSCCC